MTAKKPAQLPHDFLQPLPGGGPRRSDILIAKLCEARRDATGKDPAKKAAAQDLIGRLWEALHAGDGSTTSVVDVMRMVIACADAEEVELDGSGFRPARAGDGRPDDWSEARERDLRLIMADYKIRMAMPRAEVPRDVLREAMWPARGTTKRARWRLARALGWKGKAESFHVVLMRGRTERRKQ